MSSMSWDEVKYTILGLSFYQLHYNISIFPRDDQVSVNINFSDWLNVHHVDLS